MIDQKQPGEILNKALPYIQQFHGHTFVIKYGGSAMRDPAAMMNVIRNVLLLQLVGIRPVLVHGGGPEIDKWLDRLGIEKRVANGLRITDETTMEVVEMALSGRANKALVSQVQLAGGQAIGLSGRDGNLLLGRAVSEELGRVGDVEQVNTAVIEMALNNGFLPVICSVAADEHGNALNVNADIAASAIASALEATKLILLTDTDGLYADATNRNSLISQVSVSQAKQMIESGKATSGMIPKLEAAIGAIEGGVQSVHLINGGKPNTLLVEIFTDEGIGTMVKPDDLEVGKG